MYCLSSISSYSVILNICLLIGNLIFPKQPFASSDPKLDSLLIQAQKDLVYRGDTSLASQILETYLHDGPTLEKQAELLSKLLELQGLKHYKMGNYKEAIETYTTKLSIDSINQYSNLMIVDYQQLSNLYYYQGLYYKSMSYDMMCIELAKKLGKDLQIIRCYNNKATNHQIVEEHDLAMEAYEYSASILDSFGINDSNVNAHLLVTGNLAKLYIDKGDWVKAKSAVQKTELILSLYDEVRPLYKGSFFSNWASILKNENSLDLAKRNLKKALMIFSENNYIFEKTRSELYLAETFYEENRYDSSLYFVTRVLSSCDTNDYLQFQYLSHELLAKIYERLEKPRLAVKHLHQFFTLKDSFNHVDLRKKVATLNKKYEIKDKEAIIEKQNHELTREKLKTAKKKNTIFFLIALSLIFGILILALVFYFRKIKVRLLASKYRNEKFKAEIYEYERKIKIKQREEFSQNLLNSKQIELVDSCINELSSISDHEEKKFNGIITRTIRKLQTAIDDVDRNKSFIKHFSLIDTDFIENLTLKHPNLTNNDVKHSALVILNLSQKEAANLLGIGIKGVEIARYRLKKKLGLESTQSLRNYLIKFRSDNL